MYKYIHIYIYICVYMFVCMYTYIDGEVNFSLLGTYT
jgi:hypothetical protein